MDEDERRRDRGEQGVVTWGPRSTHELQQLVRSHLGPLLDAPPSTLVVDLSGVVPLSSGTVTTLLWMGAACRSRGVRVRLRHVPRAWAPTLGHTRLGGTATSGVRA